MPKKKRGSKPKQESNDDGYPKVSILTPLYNRNKWLPLMMANVCHFNYDKRSWNGSSLILRMVMKMLDYSRMKLKLKW